MYDSYTNNEKTAAADVCAFSYHWLRDSGLYKIVPNMKYFHRVRSDSYWVSEASSSQPLSDSYHNKIIDLEGYND